MKIIAISTTIRKFIGSYESNDNWYFDPFLKISDSITKMFICLPPMLCRRVRKTASPIDKNYLPPPKSFFCPDCACQVSTDVCMDDLWFLICWVPVGIISRDYDRYFVCAECNNKINLDDKLECGGCNTLIPVGFNYCAVCGYKNLQKNEMV